MQVVAECSDLSLLNRFATSVLASLASAPLNLGEKFRCARNRTSRFKFWAVAVNRNCSETFHNRRRRCASPKTESALFVEHAPPNLSAYRNGIDFAMLGAQLHSSCVRPPVREWKRELSPTKEVQARDAETTRPNRSNGASRQAEQSRVSASRVFAGLSLSGCIRIASASDDARSAGLGVSFSKSEVSAIVVISLGSQLRFRLRQPKVKADPSCSVSRSTIRPRCRRSWIFQPRTASHLGLSWPIIRACVFRKQSWS